MFKREIFKTDEFQNFHLNIFLEHHLEEKQTWLEPVSRVALGGCVILNEAGPKHRNESAEK